MGVVISYHGKSGLIVTWMENKCNNKQANKTNNILSSEKRGVKEVKMAATTMQLGNLGYLTSCFSKHETETL